MLFSTCSHPPHLGCTGRPSGGSPCRACSCCAARSHAARKDADPPEHATLILTLSLIQNSDAYDVADADSDAYTVPSHHSSHPTVVEELGVEVHSTSSLGKITF